MPDTIPVMGRPAKGEAARTIPAATKISRAEKRALEARFGTVHRALRAGVELVLDGEPRITSTTAAGDTQRCRVHAEWDVSEPWFDHGEGFVKKTCTTCGYETVSRAK